MQHQHPPLAAPPGAGGPGGGHYAAPAAAYAAPPQHSALQQHAPASAPAGRDPRAGYAAPPMAAAPPPAASRPHAPMAGSKRPYEADQSSYQGAGPSYPPQAAAPAIGTGYPPAGAAADGSGDAKRQHLAAAAAVPRESVYRLVLDLVDTALIIGRGGGTVRQIEQTTGGRVKRLQEPPGAREQVVVCWNATKDVPSQGRVSRNTAQEALLECVRRVVFQENAPMGQRMTARMLISRSQEQGVLENMGAIVSENPGTSLELKRQQELPPCALDNDVLVELTGEKYSLLSAVEALSHVLREHPILERPGGAPPALRGTAGPPPPAAAGVYGAPPAYGAAGYRAY